MRQAAKKDRKLQFTALLHHVNVDLLRSSYYSLKKQAAPGVDGVTWEEYGEGLEERTSATCTDESIAGHIKRNRREESGYRNPMEGNDHWASRRWKTKSSSTRWGSSQPDLGRGLSGFSYGFRPGRSQHDALDALYVGIMRKKVNYVWIWTSGHSSTKSGMIAWTSSYEHRIGDQRIVRLIQKWLKAGVMEDGQWFETKEGTPQGAVISPMLANLYLHYVLDLWVDAWRKKEAHGDVIVVRYADDAVLGFQYREEAERFPGGVAGTHGEVRAGAASGEDAPD